MKPLPPFPPLIVPLLDRLVIVPAFHTPAPPAPPRIADGRSRRSAADRAAVGQRRDRAGVRHAGAARAASDRAAAPPFPPLIAPLLVRVADRPGVRHARAARAAVEVSAVSAADRAAVGQRRDRPGVRHARAARRPPSAVSAADLAAVGQRRDRPGVRHARAARAARSKAAAADGSGRWLVSEPIVAP